MQVPTDRLEDDQHARAVALALARENEKLETEHEATESPPRPSEDTGVDNANRCHKRRLYRRRWVSALAAVLVSGYDTYLSRCHSPSRDTRHCGCTQVLLYT
jgi:hypothetical protein